MYRIYLVVIIFLFFSSTVLATTFRVPLRVVPKNIDPQRVLEVSTATVGNQIFETLYRFTSTNDLEPVLVKSHILSSDGKSITIILKENHTFSDGTPLKAKHVFNMFHRVVNILKEKIEWALGDIQGFKAVVSGDKTVLDGILVEEDYKIKISFTRSFPHFLKILSASWFGVGLKKNGRWIGTGNYVYDSQDENSLVLKARQTISPQSPQILKFVRSDSPEEDFKLMRSGKVDVVVFDRITNTSINNFKYIEQDYLQAIVIALNPKDEHFNTQEKRCNFINAFKLSAAKAGYDWEKLDLRLPFYRNLFQSKDQKMTDGGVNTSIKIYNSDSVGSFWQILNSSILSNLKKFGYTASMDSLLIYDLINKTRTGQYSVAFYGYLLDYPDPDALLYPTLYSNQQFNIVNFSSAEVDRLLQSARTTFDKSKRSRFYRKVIEFLLQDCSVGFLGGQKMGIFISHHWIIPELNSLGFHRIRMSEIRRVND